MAKLVSSSAFTLLELLIAAYILIIGISSTLLLNVNAMTSTQYAWDLTQATIDGEQILEEMQLKESLNDLMNTDWAAFAAQRKLNSLPQETVQVEYGNPQDDPLEIKVTVHWKRKFRDNNVTLATKLTK